MVRSAMVGLVLRAGVLKLAFACVSFVSCMRDDHNVPVESRRDLCASSAITLEAICLEPVNLSSAHFVQACSCAPHAPHKVYSLNCEARDACWTLTAMCAQREFVLNWCGGHVGLFANRFAYQHAGQAVSVCGGTREQIRCLVPTPFCVSVWSVSVVCVCVCVCVHKYDLSSEHISFIPAGDLPMVLRLLTTFARPALMQKA